MVKGFSNRRAFAACLLVVPAILFFAVGAPLSLPAGTLSDPQVDAYNVHVGTETFEGLYKFTSNTLLVETAQAMTNMGSDIIKLYLGANTSGQSGVTRPANVTNLITLVRDEPSYHQVLDMPFRHFVMWAYPLENADEWWGSGYNSTQGAKDYQEMFALTQYLLTNYNNSGKTFYLGHWEGDGYLEVNGWTTNPSPATIQGMIGWLNNRQQAVDDAKKATIYTNVNVYNYAEANRVRDAMLNGPNNNQRVVNMVLPFITNLDYLSYSSYDAQNLSAADLYTTLDYMQAHLPTAKANLVPGPRMWIGEYGRGGNLSTDAQEPFTRAYIQRLLNWNNNGQIFPFILFWEIYNNEPGQNFCLINSNNVKVASWYLHNYFINDGRLLAAQFRETHGRLPTDLEFVSLITPLLNQPLPAPAAIAANNVGASISSNLSATVSGTVAQGIYGDDEAGVWLYYGRQDGGTVRSAWEGNRFLGVNTNFNPATFSATLSGLAPQTNYYFRFFAINASNSVWSPASAQFSTTTLNASDYGSRLKISFPGYQRGESLNNFPVLVNLSTNLPGFSYRQFASPTGGDLRFTDAGGATPIPHEIDEWNTNGASSVWVNVPQLTATNNFIWAYWGNPAATNLPASATNGAVWPNYRLVWHLKENGFPFADSTAQWSARTGVAPAQTAGVIGHGQSFNGTTTFLDAGTVNNLGDEFTLSAWENLAPTASNIQAIWANQKGGFGSAGFALFLNSFNTSDGKILLDSGDGTAGVETASSAGAVNTGQWHLVSAAISRTSGSVAYYVDGAPAGGGSVATDFVNNADLNFGRFTNGSFYFKGALDEARIQSGIQSSNWIWASWMTVASNTALASYSPPSRQLPPLTISAAGTNGFSLIWPGSAVGFGLFTATNLTPPIIWTLATNVPMWTSNEWQIALSNSAETVRFYRLQSQ